MEFYRIVNKFYEENTYLIGEDNSSCYVIDPGKDYKLILNEINAHFKTVKAILLTHGHLDHIGSVDRLVTDFNCPVYMSDKDIYLVDGSLADTRMRSTYIKLETKTTDIYKLEDKNIIVYETPGHSKGSVCYFFKKENIMFTGDTLFNVYVGRTDLIGGSTKELKESLRFLATLDDSITIYPGHENHSTLGVERIVNSYFGKV